MKTAKIKVELTIKVRDDGGCSAQCQGMPYRDQYGWVVGCVLGKFWSPGKRHPDCIKAEKQNA